MTWNPNLDYGQSGDWFGNIDYTGNLKEIWDAHSPGEERQRKLAERRQEILSWMRDPANVDKIRERNRQGQTGGLYERIAKGDLGYEQMGTGGSPLSADHFGYADLYAGRAAGHSWGYIQKYLDANPNRLRDTFVPGGGGLYDEVATEARITKQAAEDQKFGELSDSIKEMTAGFGKQMEDIVASQETFHSDQSDWRAKESELQRAHESQMLAEQRKVRTATPTHVKNPVSQLAIGPGRVAAPQSASSLARKRLGSAPLVTGLNIGTKKTSMNIR